MRAQTGTAVTADQAQALIQLADAFR